MVTSSGYALLAALLPWIVCSIRGVLEPEGSDPEEVPKDEDRLQCLRQDNLDLVGTADFASRYILRQVVGVNEDDTESDIYLFADKFRISRVQAELKLSRTGADALAFELVGSNSTEKHTGLGSADMRIREFQLVTQSSVISCATSLASSLAEDCDDPEEQRLCLALTMMPKRGLFCKANLLNVAFVLCLIVEPATVACGACPAGRPPSFFTSPGRYVQRSTKVAGRRTSLRRRRGHLVRFSWSLVVCSLRLRSCEMRTPLHVVACSLMQINMSKASQIQLLR